MPYTFELTFTGLIIFTFTGDKQSPSEVNALLVDGTHHREEDKHVPLLSWNPRNQHRFPVPPHRLVPLPDGSLLALHGLEDRVVEIGGLPDDVIPKVSAKWRGASDDPLGEAPQNDDEERWLDWAMALQRMNPETPDPKDQAPYAGLDSGEVARVRITRGDLYAKGFPRDANGKYVVWEFKVPGKSLYRKHAMAGSIVLSIPDIPDDHPIELTHGTALHLILAPTKVGDTVRVAVTNLPDLAKNASDETAPLEHFRYFYDVVKFPQGAPPLRLPHRRGLGITRDNSFCPPTTHTQAESPT